MGSGLGSFGRLGRPARQILQALAAGPRVPLAIREEAEARCAVDLGPGTLFGAIARLERFGLIEVLPASSPRRAYRLTALGVETLAAELASASRDASDALSAPSMKRSLIR